jgi:hypothetical protein
MMSFNFIVTNHLLGFFYALCTDAAICGSSNGCAFEQHLAALKIDKVGKLLPQEICHIDPNTGRVASSPCQFDSVFVLKNQRGQSRWDF